MLLAALGILGAQGEPLVLLEPFANVDPANARAAWEIIEAQDNTAFTAILADEAELFVDWQPVERNVQGFAQSAADCDLASDFVWSSNVLGPVAPFEAKLTCIGPEGYPKKLSIYFDNQDRVVAIEISEPIVVKF